jgi:hypothetical protein
MMTREGKIGEDRILSSQNLKFYWPELFIQTGVKGANLLFQGLNRGPHLSDRKDIIVVTRRSNPRNNLLVVTMNKTWIIH